MMHAYRQGLARRVIAVLILAGAASPLAAQTGTPLPTPSAPKPTSTETCDRCGTITSIRQATSKDSWTPLGTLSSGGTGNSDLAPLAITQYQVGRDLSKQGTVLLGAAGGVAYQSRPSALNVQRWELVVRMDDGSVRSVTQNYQPMLQSGDRVRVFGTQVELL
jgi:outer membrane lipoprotein SlyB